MGNEIRYSLIYDGLLLKTIDYFREIEDILDGEERDNKKILSHGNRKYFI